MGEATKALSIMQPWAWLIVHGHKDIENRTWETRFSGPVLIHAGKRFDPNMVEEGDIWWPWPEIAKPADFEMGGIVGEAEIRGCVTSSLSPWFEGPFGFVLDNARPLPFRPCRGQLGFFVPDFAPAAPRPSKPSRGPRQGSLL